MTTTVPDADAVFEHLNGNHADSVLFLARHVAGDPALTDAELLVATSDGVEIEVRGDEGDRRVQLAAPTGRAAKRMSEATGRDAKTIHRLLEFEPKGGQFQRNRHNPLEADAVVIDETSMVAVELAESLEETDRAAHWRGVLAEVRAATGPNDKTAGAAPGP